MSQALQIQLSDAAFAALQRTAHASAKSPEELAAAALEQQFGNAGGPAAQAPLSPDVQALEARQRFERHFGAIHLGYPTGADNQGIDADLARAYADGHGEG
jgi:hypothetical protein